MPLSISNQIRTQRAILFVTIIFFSTHGALGQQHQHITIKGEVRDAMSKAPLTLVHVKIKNKPIGVPTNEEGKFALHLSGTAVNDSILISHLGYVSKTLPMQALLQQGFHTILLSKDTLYLQEIVVKDLDPEGIVKAVAGRLKENYATTPFEMEGFYRNAYKELDTYVRQYQAAFTGFDANFLNRNGLTVGIIKKNISRDFRKFKWRQVEGNAPWHYLWKIRRQLDYFFSGKKYQKYEIAVEEVDSFEGEEVYKLQFVLKDTTERITVSQAHVRARDNAVLQISGETKIVDPKKFNLGDSLVMAYMGGSILVKYVNYNGKMYPSYSRSQYQHTVYNGQSEAVGGFDMYEEVIIHEIRSPSINKNKKAFLLALEARRQELPSDSVFWKQYNLPVETALSRAIAKDLEAWESGVK